jgi:hypothetical protein
MAGSSASRVDPRTTGAPAPDEERKDPFRDEFVRLAADMQPFRFQIVSIAHHSQGAVEGVLSGAFAPPSMTSDHDFEGLLSLVGGAIEKLQQVSPQDLDAKADGRVDFSLGKHVIPFKPANFLLSFSLPNFYFHCATAYDLLRLQGAPLGKRDYLGALRIGV